MSISYNPSYDNNNCIQCNTSIESLLNNQNWCNCPDIVRITINALYDNITFLNNKINKLECDILNKVSINDFQNCLSTKVDMSDHINAINSLSKNIQSHPSMDHIKFIDDDKISKNDFNNIMKDYTLNNDIKIKNLIDCPNSNCLNDLASNINCQMDNLVREINKKLNCVATINDIKKINQVLCTKANISDLNDYLTSKADKDEVINILRTKCDKIDFDVQMKKKIDVTEYNELINLLNSKANFDELEEIKLNLGNKIEKSYLNPIIENINNKLELKEFNSFIECEYKKYIEDNDRKIKDINEDFDRLICNIKNQFNNINCVVNKIDNDKIGKSTYEDLVKKMQNKIDKKEFLGSINQFQFDTNEKLNNIQNNNEENLKQTEEIFNTKLNDLSCNINKNIDSINYNIENINCHINENDNQIEKTYKNLEEIGNKISFIQSENESKFCHLYEILKSKLDINEFKEVTNSLDENLKNKIKTGLDDKASYNDLELLYKKIKKDLNDRLNSFEDDTKNTLNNFDNTINILSQEKLNIKDLNVLLKDKFDYLEDLIKSQFKEKSMDDIDTEIRKLNLQIQQKIDKEKYYDDQMKNKNSFDNLANSIRNFYTKNEMVDLLKEKSDVSEINKIVNIINEKLEEKVPLSEFNPFYELQNSINNLYLCDNCFGRWIWKSGNLKSGKVIPFEIQYSNTNNNNFLWEKNKGSIMISKGGIYHILIGIFNKGKNAVINVLINGENVITNSELSHVINSERKNFNIDVSSITINNFIFIPDKARISIVYDCEDNNKSLYGFLELKAMKYSNKNDDVF